MVPHATDLIQEWIKEVAGVSVDGSGSTPDVCLIEVGQVVYTSQRRPYYIIMDWTGQYVCTASILESYNKYCVSPY